MAENDKTLDEQVRIRKNNFPALTVSRRAYNEFYKGRGYKLFDRAETTAPAPGVVTRAVTGAETTAETTSVTTGEASEGAADNNPNPEGDNPNLELNKETGARAKTAAAKKGSGKKGK